MRALNYLRSLTLALLLMGAAAPAAALPDVEQPITVTGDFRFAGVASSDASPDLVEVAAIGGEATVWFFNTSTNPDTRWPSGNAPWWEAGGAIGVTYFTIPEGLPRPFNVRGTGVDTIHIEMGTATSVIVSCSKKR